MEAGQRSGRSQRALTLAIVAALVAVLLIPSVVAGSPRTKRISVRSGGAEVAQPSRTPAISADGRFVAFISSSDALVASDDNGYDDIYVRDRRHQRTRLVSVALAGGSGDGGSVEPSISADGRFVAFESDASDLIAGDRNDSRDVFVRDRKRRRTWRVSVRTGGAEVTGDSFRASISADGRFVAFASDSDELVDGDENGATDVFVHDRRRRRTHRVSIPTSGGEASGDSRSPIISADGRFVVFHSEADDLVGGDGDHRDVFIHDRRHRRTRLISVPDGGGVADDFSADPEVSANGRFVVFHSRAENLVGDDSNGLMDVFVRDRRRKKTRRINIPAGGGQAREGLSRDSHITPGGRFIVYESFATNLIDDDTNLVLDVFIRDRRKGRTRRLSIATDRAQGDARSRSAAISADGRFVAFDSDTAFVGRDANGVTDLYVRGPLRRTVRR